MNNSEYFEAGRRNTSSRLLSKLAKSPCPKIRARVAENPASPSRLIEALSQDDNEDVRIGIGYNPSTPIATLWNLAMDQHLDVRFSLAENANTIPLILLWLSEDDNPYIAQRAQTTMSILSIFVRTNKPIGEFEMATKTIERTLRRMLNSKERLNKADAIQLRKLILDDGYLSKSEKKIVQYAIDNDLLEDTAFEIFLELLLKKHEVEQSKKAIA